ncbi:hypothetical protein D9M70_540730 [compost metagenome]
MAHAAAHQQAALPRLRAVLAQGVAVETGTDEGFDAGGAGDEQGRLGQSVARQEGHRVEADAGEAPSEGLQAVLTNRLGAGEQHLQAAQVEPVPRGVTDAFGGQAESEIRCASVGGAITVDGLQPARRPLDEVTRRHQHQGGAAIDRQ